MPSVYAVRRPVDAAGGKRRAAAAALATALLLAGGCGPSGGDVDLTREVSGVSAEGRPLQVVLHDLMERVPGGAVRVCRALADRPVDLQVADPTPLRDVLGELARQVGAGFVPSAALRRGGALPTLRCPGDSGDYLVIGSHPVSGSVLPGPRRAALASRVPAGEDGAAIRLE